MSSDCTVLNIPNVKQTNQTMPKIQLALKHKVQSFDMVAADFLKPQIFKNKKR